MSINNEKKTIAEKIPKEKKYKKFISISKENKLKQNKIILLFLMSSILAFLIIPRQEMPVRKYAIGEIAEKNIKANKDYLITDHNTTDLKKKEASENIRPIYDYFVSKKKAVVEDIKKMFSKGRSLIEFGESKDPSANLESIRSTIYLDVNEDIYNNLIENKFSNTIETPILMLIEKSMAEMIISKKENLYYENKKGIKVRSIDNGKFIDDQSLEAGDLSRIIDIEISREQISIWADTLDNIKNISDNKKEVIIALAQQYITPNLILNEELTKKEIETIASNVNEVTVSIKKGEIIVRKGDRISDVDLTILDGIIALSPKETRFEKFISLFLLLSFFFFLMHYFARRLTSRYNPSFKDMILISTLFVGTILMMNLINFISNNILESVPHIPPSAYKFVVPVFAAVMLLRLIFNPEVAIFFTIAISVFLGISVELNSPISESALLYSVFLFLGNIYTIGSVSKVKQRVSLIKAGLFIGCANIVTVSFLLFVSLGFGIIDNAYGFFYTLVLTSLGGILSGIIVLGIMPIFESFGYVTDIKLLELANTEHPLLTKLAIQAPGTNHHSFVVSRIAESAAEAIGANSLFAKVASLYHDIGKIEKPLYFIENVVKGLENKHDKLAPRMSSLILQAHVKDGIELAKKHRLPESIIEIIPEHHGSSLISFFYNKAKKNENPEMDSVDELDYRYPGPKPRSKEAAIIMLADATEAATKSLPDPSAAKLKGMVTMIVNKFFTDGQLDSCDLTFNDLKIIQKNFIQVLTSSIYHQRVEYPGQKKGK
ncbi:MAG: HDIG domain-containing metalloprotein [Pseudomonadota bacterium]